MRAVTREPRTAIRDRGLYPRGRSTVPSTYKITIVGLERPI